MCAANVVPSNVFIHHRSHSIADQFHITAHIPGVSTPSTLRPASSNASSLLRATTTAAAAVCKDETSIARTLHELGSCLIKLVAVKARLQAAVATSGPSGVCPAGARHAEEQPHTGRNKQNNGRNKQTTIQRVDGDNVLIHVQYPTYYMTYCTTYYTIQHTNTLAGSHMRTMTVTSRRKQPRVGGPCRHHCAPWQLWKGCPLPPMQPAQGAVLECYLFVCQGVLTGVCVTGCIARERGF